MRRGAKEKEYLLNLNRDLTGGTKHNGNLFNLTN